MFAKPDFLEVVTREGFIASQKGNACWIKHHGEKTSSCKISLDKQTFHCYGCGAHGDIIDFVMDLHKLNFNDACKYLGIIPGKQTPIDPTIQRRKKIQKDYEAAIHNLWEKFCKRSRELYHVKFQVKDNPRALTEPGADYFAALMGDLTEVDFKIETLINGTFEEKMILLRDNEYGYCRKIKSAAA